MVPGLKLDWVNRGERPFLIRVGTLVSGVVDPRVQISISGPGIPLGHLIDTSLPPAVGGNVDPLVVCLVVRFINMPTYAGAARRLP